MPERVDSKALDEGRIRPEDVALAVADGPAQSWVISTVKGTCTTSGRVEGPSGTLGTQVLDRCPQPVLTAVANRPGRDTHPGGLLEVDPGDGRGAGIGQAQVDVPERPLGPSLEASS